MMLKGLAIDNMVIGGPAHNTGLLEKGDLIIAIDGVAVTEETIHAALLGDDIPGSQVVLTIRRSTIPELNFIDAGSIASAVFRHADAVFNPNGSNSRENSPLTNKNTREVVLVRMATEIIADRRHMFELFTEMKVTTCAFHSFLSQSSLWIRVGQIQTTTT